MKIFELLNPVKLRKERNFFKKESEKWESFQNTTAERLQKANKRINELIESNLKYEKELKKLRTDFINLNLTFQITAEKLREYQNKGKGKQKKQKGKYVPKWKEKNPNKTRVEVEKLDSLTTVVHLND